MSFADPNETPPNNEDANNVTSFIACAVVHSGIQFGMATWFFLMFLVAFGFSPNFWLVWLSFSIIFVSLFWYEYKHAAECLLKQFVGFLLASIFVALNHYF